jgi:hypothetical protein
MSLLDRNVVLAFDTPEGTIYTLAAGTLLLLAGVASFVWVYGALPFAFGSLAGLFGVLAMTLLAFLLFVYAWSYLVRGLTEVIARGVEEGSGR